MLESGDHPSRPRKIALIGNFLPRQCGIATFTSDLLAALSEENPAGDHFAVVMNDIPEGYRYPGQVRFEVNQRVLAEYRLAADFLNMNRVEVVCLQHEFGIFGGDNGVHILDLLGGLRMPLVTTLHSVIQAPTQGQMTVTKRIAQLSDRLVVMSRKAEQILETIYGVPAEKNRPDSPRHSRRAVCRSQFLQGPIRRRRSQGDFDLRLALSGQGRRDDDRRLAGGGQAAPAGRLYCFRSDPSAREKGAGRSLPPLASAPRPGTGCRRPCDFSQSLRRFEGIVRVSRRGGHLRHALSEPGADRFGDVGSLTEKCRTSR